MVSKLNHIRDKKGFTLIELLIVIAIIGILAAIAIPQLSHYKQRIYDNASKADLQNLYLACKAYWSDKGSDQSCSADASGAGGTDYGFKASSNVLVSVTIPNIETTWAATAKHASSDNTFTMDSSGNIS